MKTYSKNKVMELLKLTKKTIKVYCEELEEQGYYFDLDSSGYRIFTDEDISILARIKKVEVELQAINITTSEAVNIVLKDNAEFEAEYKASLNEVASAEELVIDSPYEEPPLTGYEVVDRVLQEFNELKYSNFQVLDRMQVVEKNQEIMLQAFDKLEKDRDQVLMMVLRTVLDEKKAREEGLKKKGFFSRFKKK
jgi:DNA-binding transcriptional MerR regulator